MEVAPAHLDKEAFLTVTKVMVEQRLEAKANGDKVVADSLKITINVGLFGKYNFAYSFLFDTLCTLTITINGQLMLLMLIERLALKGIKNLSANTDGIVCWIPEGLLDTYYQVCDEWAKEVNFLFEYTEYIKYFRLDVNNYITVKKLKDGTLDVKRKGGLNQNLCIEDLKKGFNKPIVAKAVEEYLINGTPVGDTIRNERNIYLFCATQNIDASFDPVYRTVSNGKIVETKLQKNVRFYVSKRGGALLKVRGDKKTGIMAGHNVTIFNDYVDHENFEDYEVQYTYYINEARKLINIIESGVKGTKKKDLKSQSNRFMNSLFGDDVMEDIKIPFKKGDMSLADDSSDVSEYLMSDDDDEDTTRPTRVIDENIYNNLVSDKGFDDCEGYATSFPTGDLGKSLDELIAESHRDYLADLGDTDNGDLPF